jgi:Protein of unknown function (DUF2281)
MPVVAGTIKISLALQLTRRTFTMPTIAERLWEIAHTLPEPLLAEVLDFAEFLRARQARQEAARKTMSLASLCGGLSESTTFAGSPLDIQNRLRDEWH